MQRISDPSVSLSPSSKSNAHHCGVCHRSFKRSGHLRRHSLTHADARPFPCSRCSRSFTRRDALQRHASAHLDAPSLLQQGIRACVACAGAKTRCSGDVPCKRCRNRKFPCVIPGSEDRFIDESLSPEIVLPNTILAPSAAEQLDVLPTVPPHHRMPVVESYPCSDWDSNPYTDINWLEGPFGAALDLSPFSWEFGPYLHGTGSLDDRLPLPAPEREHVLGLSNNFATATSESSSHSGRDITSPDQASGRYYVDSVSNRLPRVVRPTKPTNAQETVQAVCSSTFSLQIPNPGPLLEVSNPVGIEESNYRTICEMYDRLCRLEAHGQAPFTSDDFPPRSMAEAMIALFRENFNDVLPFLHQTTFTNILRAWELDLAMIAVGSQFLAHSSCSASFHELLRRCLIYGAAHQGSNAYTFTFDRTSALLLNIVGLAYSGHQILCQTALQARLQLWTAFVELKGRHEGLDTSTRHENVTQKWQAWIQRESETRLAYSIWLVDAMLAIHHDTTASFQLQSITFPLPASETLWQCERADDWSSLHEQQPLPTQFSEVLQKLYLSKSFSNTNSEFVRIIVIHGLFYRLWEVERYYSDPLSLWEPLAARTEDATLLAKPPAWLYGIPNVRNWQSVSCDALDVLHWQANSTIGQLQGLEHPTVLHLHFARIVLLCPCHDILALVHNLTFTSPKSSERVNMTKTIEIVRRWAVHHQYKARLAMIHAGVTFWHIRRHGVDGFYEPSSLAMAALVLWAFSIFADRKSRSAMGDKQESMALATPSVAVLGNCTSNDVGDADQDISEDDEILLLDRPTDDELVQQFIRDGASMRPMMSGVGEVFSPNAPPRILTRAIGILRQTKCWGVSTEWVELLQLLRASTRLETKAS